MDDSLAKYTERARSALGLKQNQLAERTDLPATTINRIEKGVTKLPSADIRRKLARGLGVSHLDLLVAAGEITRDEVERDGITSKSLSDVIPAKVIAAMSEIPEWTDWHINYVVNSLNNLRDMEDHIVEVARKIGASIDDAGAFEFPLNRERRN